MVRCAEAIWARELIEMSQIMALAHLKSEVRSDLLRRLRRTARGISEAQQKQWSERLAADMKSAREKRKKQETGQDNGGN